MNKFKEILKTYLGNLIKNTTNGNLAKENSDLQKFNKQIEFYFLTIKNFSFW